MPSASFLFLPVLYYLEIYGDFLCEGIHLKTKGEPKGPPTGHRRPLPRPTGDPRLGPALPVGYPLAASDAYKISKSLILTARPLSSTEDIPTRRHLKP